MTLLARQLVRTVVLPSTLDIEQRVPDATQVFVYEDMKIEDARNLRDLLGLRSEGQHLWVLAIDAITTEAQQALLKVFEESTTTLLVVVPDGIQLLPTVLSRFTETTWPHDDPNTFAADAHDWVQLPVHQRLDWIEREKNNLTVARVRAMVQALMAQVPRTKARGQALMQASRYLEQSGVPPVMLLEYLAISL